MIGNERVAWDQNRSGFYQDPQRFFPNFKHATKLKCWCQNDENWIKSALYYAILYLWFSRFLTQAMSLQNMEHD